MQQLSAIVLEHQHHDNWVELTLGARALATTQPGQFVAVRCTHTTSHDPLLRQPLFVAATDQQAGTCTLLVPVDHPAYGFLNQQPRGAALDILGPLGHGWMVDASVRTVALLGTASQAAALFALAHDSVQRGRSVTILLGADDRLDAPAPFLLPAAAEYNVAHGSDAAVAALSLLDDQLVRWADLVAIALPHDSWAVVALQIRKVRLQWNRGFAQAVALPALACCIGICGVCTIETRQTAQLACVDGPIFDLRDLIR